MAEDRLEEAETRLRQAERIRKDLPNDLPDYAETLASMGRLHLYQGQPRQAVEKLEQASARDPSVVDAAFWTTLGRAYLALNERDKAFEAPKNGLRLSKTERPKPGVGGEVRIALAQYWWPEGPEHAVELALEAGKSFTARSWVTQELCTEIETWLRAHVREIPSTIPCREGRRDSLNDSKQTS